MVPMTGGSSTAVKILGTALAGAMGDTTDQIISNGKVDVVRTIKSGLMSAATAAAGAVISKAVSSTAGRTLYNSKGDASPGKAQEQSKPKVKVHGNSKLSTKSQHGYEIYNTKTNDVVKTGISGQKLNLNGTSPRANAQVNAFNRAANDILYKARIVATNMPNRATALAWEAENALRLYQEGNSMAFHSRPAPWK